MLCVGPETKQSSITSCPRYESCSIETKHKVKTSMSDAVWQPRARKQFQNEMYKACSVSALRPKKSSNIACPEQLLSTPRQRKPPRWHVQGTRQEFSIEYQVLAHVPSYISTCPHVQHETDGKSRKKDTRTEVTMQSRLGFQAELETRRHLFFSCCLTP